MITQKLPSILAAGCLGLTALFCPSAVVAQAYVEVSSGDGISEDFFYDQLQDDGIWVESNDYGYIWQPHLAREDRDWRPYTNGRWSYSDRGWVWVSEEPFGWATYHYGRWVNLDNDGWYWVPGTTWAPAWVSWRSNDRYLGWAPLPPEARIQRGGHIRASVDVSFDVGPSFYTFISYEDVGERNYRDRWVPRDRNVTIINETTNVTNIVYNDIQVNNYGPDYNQVSKRSRRPVDEYRIETNRDIQRKEFRTEQPRDGIFAAYAPNFREDAVRNQDRKPRKVDRKIAAAQRDQGWKGLDPEQVRQTKTSLQERQKAAPQRDQRDDEAIARKIADRKARQPDRQPRDQKGAEVTVDANIQRDGGKNPDKKTDREAVVRQAREDARKPSAPDARPAAKSDQKARASEPDAPNQKKRDAEPRADRPADQDAPGRKKNVAPVVTPDREQAPKFSAKAKERAVAAKVDRAPDTAPKKRAAQEVKPDREQAPKVSAKPRERAVEARENTPAPKKRAAQEVIQDREPVQPRKQQAAPAKAKAKVAPTQAAPANPEETPEDGKKKGKKKSDG